VAKIADAFLKGMGGGAALFVNFRENTAILRHVDFSQESNGDIPVAYLARSGHQFFHLTSQQLRFLAGNPPLQDLQYLPEFTHCNAQIVHRFNPAGFGRASGLQHQRAQETGALFGREPGDGFIGHGHVSAIELPGSFSHSLR